MSEDHSSQQEYASSPRDVEDISKTVLDDMVGTALAKGSQEESYDNSPDGKDEEHINWRNQVSPNSPNSPSSEEGFQYFIRCPNIKQGGPERGIRERQHHHHYYSHQNHYFIPNSATGCRTTHSRES